MSAIRVYVTFPGTARQALERYASIFGGELSLHSFEEFGRTDGPPDAIAHGMLTGPVSLGGSDAPDGGSGVRTEGLMLSLLGSAAPETLHEWFDDLAEGGRVVDALQERPWGATDGQVIDSYGLHWLIGYEGQG
jgi:PhnB protein